MLRCKPVSVTPPSDSTTSGILAAALADLTNAALKRVRHLAGESLARELARAGAPDQAQPAQERAGHGLRLATAELAAMGVTLDGVEPAVTGIRVRATAQRATVDAARVRSLVEAIVLVRAPDVDAIQVEIGGKPVTAANFVSIARLKPAT